MRPEVEEYLAKYEEEKAKRNQEKMARINQSQQLERKKTLIAAGLYTSEDREISKAEYDFLPGNAYGKKINGEMHYFQRGKKIPLEVTDEEYEAILRTMQEKKNEIEVEEEEEEEEEKTEEKGGSWAARFCRRLAIFLWIGGFIASIILSIKEVEASGSYSSRKELQFDFLAFLIWASVYFVSGGLVMCLSEHFKNLHAILEELKESNRLKREG